MSYYVRLFAPLATGMGTAALVPSMKNQGKQLYQTPPGWVFGLMWPALFIGVGYAWSEAAKVDPLQADLVFGILTGLFVLWIIVATGLRLRFTDTGAPVGRGYKRASLYILVLALMASIVGLLNTVDTLSQVSMGVLVGWLIFAMHLNYHNA